MGTPFVQLIKACAEFYISSEHLAMNEVIVLKEELFSRNIFPKSIST
jgi:hypothetical protein